MTARRAIAIVCLTLFSLSPVAYAQQVISDNVVSGAGLNDGYYDWGCDAQGRLYRRGNREGIRASVMRVARDGSTLVYRVPDAGEPRNAKVLQAFSPLSTGLAILTTKDVSGSEMYRFDGQGRLVGQRQVSLGFLPTAMAETSSGKMIVIGYRGLKRERPNVGAVLDDADKVLRVFEFPQTNLSDNEWGFGQMAAGNGVTFFVPNSPTGPIYKIADSDALKSFP